MVATIKQNAKDLRSEIHPDMNLELDLGMDSLTRAETFAALEHTFSTEFTAEEVTNALTVRAIVDMLATEGGENVDAGVTEFKWSNIVKDASGDLPEIRSIVNRNRAFGVFAFSVFSLFYLFCRIFMRLEVEGREHLEQLGQDREKTGRPFLICPNHQSYLDAFIVASTYPYSVFRDIFHVGTSGIFKGRFMEFVGRMVYVVPVDPDTQLMRAMKAGAIGLKAGKILNIYPEGERSYDGKLHEFKKGAAVLATELELPILPVALDGAYKVWPRGSWRIRPAKVKIRFGEPIKATPNDETALSADDRYEELTDRLKENIGEMIEEMRERT